MPWFRRFAALMIFAVLTASCAVDTSTPVAIHNAQSVPAQAPGEPGADGIVQGGFELNEAAAWDAMIMERYQAAGGVEPPVGHFAVAANGFCLGIVTSEQTEWMFPENDALGKAVRDLNDDDCSKQVITFMGNGPSDATTWDDMLDLRYSRTVSFDNFAAFERNAIGFCQTSGYSLSEEAAVISSSVELELNGMKNSGECDMLTPQAAAATGAGALGNQVFFRSGSSGRTISVMDLDSGEVRTVMSDAGQVRGGLATVSPSGDRVAFNRSDMLFVVDADGTNEVQLTGESVEALTPIWTSDGESIVFSETDFDSRGNPGSCLVPGQRLVVAAADGSGQRNLTRLQQSATFSSNFFPNYHPAVWRTNGRLTYVEITDCTSRQRLISVHPKTGKSSTLLDIPDRAGIIFSVSPADDRLAVAGFDDSPSFADGSSSWNLYDGNQKLYLQGELDSTLRAVPGLTGPFTDIVWSPDGQWVALLASVDRANPFNQQVLYVVSSDGTDVRELTPAVNPLEDMQFRWAPDSTQLVFSHRIPDRSYEMEITDLDGNGRRIGIGRPIGWR